MITKMIAVVTGSSSGIGFETSLLLARNGFYTYATMRDVSKSKEIVDIASRENLPLQVLQLDVTDSKSIELTIGKIVNEQKERIDVLINNAGYGLVGPLEELSIEEIKGQFETNFFGVVRMIKAVVPIMRRQRKGTIVNISSIAGKIGYPLTSAYVRSKFALEGLSESLYYELHEFGINVVIVEPGVVKTRFGDNLKIGNDVVVTRDMNNYAISPYEDIIRRRVNGFKPRFENGATPIEVAKTVLESVRSKNPDQRYQVGEDAVSMMKLRNKMTDVELRGFIIQSILNR